MRLLLLLLGTVCAEWVKQIHYAMVIDAGSTGSRAFIFRFFDDSLTGRRIVESFKGKKATPGLSSFASNPAGVTDYFEPLFQHAVQLIPREYHNETLVYIKGTAGMRLLSLADQNSIWDSLVQGLDEHHDVPFIIHKENFGTIDGHMEAYYAVLSSNYIAGGIDGSLRQTGVPMVGALDMGGSSTQLIFHTHTQAEQPVQEQDFWSHSWLNFGVEKMRERVWEYLVAQRKKDEGAGGEDSTISIDNPCAFPGFPVEHASGYRLVGTGDSSACQQVILATAFPDCDPTAADSAVPCYVDTIVHPPMEGRKFYGMSVYYYAFDCIRTLSGAELANWPTPTINELQTAVAQFCQLSWDHVQRNMIPNAHAWTRDDQLPSRCLETTYLLTLLHHGFGVGLESRDIELALEVKGFEVEWTLGFALSEVCLQCLAHHHDAHDSGKAETSRIVAGGNAGGSVPPSTSEPVAEIEAIGSPAVKIDEKSPLILASTPLLAVVLRLRRAFTTLWRALGCLFGRSCDVGVV